VAPDVADLKQVSPTLADLLRVSAIVAQNLADLLDESADFWADLR